MEPVDIHVSTCLFGGVVEYGEFGAHEMTAIVKGHADFASNRLPFLPVHAVGE